MARTRLYIDGRYAGGSVVELDDDKARYLRRVLRLHVGDRVHVFDGRGSEYEAEILALGKSTARLKVGRAIDALTESKLRVHLVQGISRGQRMDFVVQKATELGVKRITPVLTDYGAVKLDSARADRRRAHWQGVAASACEQCERVCMPLIDAPLPLRDWFAAKPARVDQEFILRPGAETPLLQAGEPATKACLLIGPEGGFSDNEYEDARLKGFEPVSLGPRILRTETAAVAAIALLQSRWGDLA